MAIVEQLINSLLSKAKLAFILSGILLLQCVSCGYSLQNTRNRLFEKEGIRKIYVSPLLNNTYKPGVENLVYNQLVRTISVNGKFILVQNAKEADAVLQGAVSTAQYGPAGTTPAENLFPFKSGPSDISVATEYSATLACVFTLLRQNTHSGKATVVIWSGDFSRSKPFPGNNQLGVYGTTSALINESEFDRALRDLAQNMMGDVQESMLVMF
jgi:hypothetical protein